MTASTQARVGALVLLIIGVLAAVQAYRLGVGTLLSPGVGLWPLIVGAVMVVSAAAVALQRNDDAEAIGRASGLVAVGAVSLVAYAALFEVTGFEIATIALVAFWLRFLGGVGWRLTAAVSIGATAVIYVLFIILLGVSLPHLIAF